MSVTEFARTSTTATSDPTAAIPPGWTKPPIVAITRGPFNTETDRPNSSATKT